MLLESSLAIRVLAFCFPRTQGHFPFFTLNGLGRERKRDKKKKTRMLKGERAKFADTPYYYYSTAKLKCPYSRQLFKQVLSLVEWDEGWRGIKPPVLDCETVVQQISLHQHTYWRSQALDLLSVCWVCWLCKSLKRNVHQVQYTLQALSSIKISQSSEERLCGQARDYLCLHDVSLPLW